MIQPKCLAFIVCESVVEDVRTHNKCILNTYNTITAASFPTVHDRMTVFISLTDGHGKVPLEIRLRQDGKTELVFKLEGEVSFGDPLAVADAIVDLRKVPLPAEGLYFLELYTGKTLLEDRRISVQRLKPT